MLRERDRIAPRNWPAPLVPPAIDVARCDHMQTTWHRQGCCMSRCQNTSRPRYAILHKCCSSFSPNSGTLLDRCVCKPGNYSSSFVAPVALPQATNPVWGCSCWAASYKVTKCGYPLLPSPCCTWKHPWRAGCLTAGRSDGRWRRRMRGWR